jgi:hypothetical protein
VSPVANSKRFLTAFVSLPFATPISVISPNVHFGPTSNE